MGPEVADYLRGLIMSGHLPPGHHLRLKDLAEHFAVSTTPIREALVMLEKEGLVEGEHHRGFRVSRLTAQDIRDIFELHAVIAGMFAERAADALSEAKLDELEAINERLRAAVESGDIETVERENYHFHRLIDTASDAALLRRFLSDLNRYVPRGHFEEIPGWLQSSYEDHEPIVAALRRRDAAAARAAAEAHIRRAGVLLADFVIARAQVAEEERSTR